MEILNMKVLTIMLGNQIFIFDEGNYINLIIKFIS